MSPETQKTAQMCGFCVAIFFAGQSCECDAKKMALLFIAFGGLQRGDKHFLYFKAVI